MRSFFPYLIGVVLFGVIVLQS